MTPLFYINVAMLALLLFFPASKLIWVLSVRRMERKLGRSLESTEIDGQRSRARFISLFLVIIFSWLFNLQLAATAHG
jgi:hypothetical protein